MADKKLEGFHFLAEEDRTPLQNPLSVCTTGAKTLEELVPSQVLGVLSDINLEAVREAFEVLRRANAAAEASAFNTHTKSLEYMMENNKLRELLVDVRRVPEVMEAMPESLRGRVKDASSKNALARVRAELTGEVRVADDGLNNVLGMAVASGPQYTTEEDVSARTKSIQQSITERLPWPMCVKNMKTHLEDFQRTLRIELELQGKGTPDHARIVRAVKRHFPADLTVKLRIL